MELLLLPVCFLLKFSSSKFNVQRETVAEQYDENLWMQRLYLRRRKASGFILWKLQSKLILHLKSKLNFPLVEISGINTGTRKKSIINS